MSLEIASGPLRKFLFTSQGPSLLCTPRAGQRHAGARRFDGGDARRRSSSGEGASLDPGAPSSGHGMAWGGQRRWDCELQRVSSITTAISRAPAMEVARGGLRRCSAERGKLLEALVRAVGA
jgi:hypothetical protein